jgi:hypothetical protein
MASCCCVAAYIVFALNLGVLVLKLLHCLMSNSVGGEGVRGGDIVGNAVG